MSLSQHPTNCDRCKGPLMNGHMMSFFNTDTLCMSCVIKEKAHPKYEDARRVEMAEVKKGNYNYPGIGLPPELAHKVAA